MRPTWTIVAILLLGMPPATASAAAWRTSVYETDGFSVAFSGGIKVEPMNLDENARKNLVRATMYSQDNGTFWYGVGASLWTADASLNFDDGVSGTMNSYKCAKTDSDVRSSLPGGSMREIFASGCENAARIGARFFLRGRWFYQVVYLISSDDQADDAKHFLASFKLSPLKI